MRCDGDRLQDLRLSVGQEGRRAEKKAPCIDLARSQRDGAPRSRWDLNSRLRPGTVRPLLCNADV